MAWSTSQNNSANAHLYERESDRWVARHRREENSFKTNCLHRALVENIQSRRAATLIIAQRKNETPLSWHEVWNDENVEFGRVLLITDRLRPSQNELAYGKEVSMFDILKEGDAVMVELKNAVKSPDNIFRYFANSAYKVGGITSLMGNSLELIRDPLRGIVDSILMKDVGVIRFGTYDGRMAKALFYIDSLHFKGEKLKKHLPLGSVSPVGTAVFLEVNKWNIKEVNQEWQKMQYKDGVIFRASLVWLKGDQRPSRNRNDKREKTNSNEFAATQANQVPVNKISKNFATKSYSEEKKTSGYTLTDINAYYGRVETILGGPGAVVCVAHRKGEPVTFNENWCCNGVSLERVFLLSNHLRPSKTAPPYAKGLHMNSLLKVGDPVRVVVQSTERIPEKLYKWFAKTSWKVNDEESGPLISPVNALPGHLHGKVENWIGHSLGIISFKTYHGISSKAFFTHDNFYKNGMKIMKHLPLGSELNKGTEVFLVADRWNVGTNLKDLDQELLKNKVGFKAILVWMKGGCKPDAESDYNIKQDQRSFGYENHRQGFQRRDFPEKHLSRGNQERHQSGSHNANTGVFKATDNKLSRARGMRYGRGRGRQRRGRGRGDSDCHSNCSENSESNMSDISTVSDYFGVMNFDEEFHSEKEENLIRFSNPDLTQPLAAQNITSGKGLNGFLVSVDEDWGIVQINEQQVHDFKCNVVYLYGLKLENIPLHRLFHQGQSVKVQLKGEKVSLLEYGSRQLPYLMREAVMTYCEQKSIPHNIKDMLDNLMKNNGI